LAIRLAADPVAEVRKSRGDEGTGLVDEVIAIVGQFDIGQAVQRTSNTPRAS